MERVKRMMGILTALAVLAGSSGCTGREEPAAPIQEEPPREESPVPAGEEPLEGDLSSREATEEELALFQEMVDEIDASFLFCTDFDSESCESEGKYFYDAACLLMGREEVENTYQYAPNYGEDSYPYTPAAVLDAVLESRFAIPAEDFHGMMAQYDAQVDGYWAPMGGGGAAAATAVTACEVEGDRAVLSCESRSGASRESDPSTFSTVEMVYSPECGWRFASCRVS